MYKFFFGVSGVQALYFMKGGRGFWSAEIVRRGIAASEFSIFNRPHSYGSTFRLGSITDSFDAWDAYRSIAYGSIYRSVPGAILGGSGDFFGNRTNNGTATAFLLGRVSTINNDSRLEITNLTQYSHLLNVGSVKMNFYEKDGYVYVTYVGTGTGNLAYINELFGKMTFDFMIKRNFRDAV